MTHYLLSVHGPAETDEFGNYGSQEEMAEALAVTGAFNDRLRADGYWVFAGGLQSASTATVVDGQGETPVMTDGPYLETKEVIAGFWIIDAPDLDVALRLAAEGPRRAGARSRSVRSTASAEPARTTTDGDAGRDGGRRAGLPRGVRPPDRLARPPLR